METNRSRSRSLSWAINITLKRNRPLFINWMRMATVLYHVESMILTTRNLMTIADGVMSNAIGSLKDW
ncbi:unnamed protein product [Angiostrongylus costaricensis]|uniref:Uncharacterized protein n=1 Tax=Angiostrongylus costaricensis TaxID=334426 RepID=A0A0R3PT82_ANGCS|nr:unnamed protein product [Angiostrongylus costaricensis]